MILFLNVFVLLLNIFVVVGLLCFIAYFGLAYRLGSKYTAPFVRIRTAALPFIIDALDLQPESVLYELGCGDGKVIFSCYKQQPRAQYIGIDNGWLPYFLARQNYKRHASPLNVEFRRENFLQTDLSPATHVFTYLMTDLMKILSPKFTKELQPGTRLVSCDFKLPDKVPTRVIDIPATKYQLCEKLYVYDY